MPSAEIVSRLAGRMLQAKARAMSATAQGKDARSIEAVGLSCRRTLAWVVQLSDSRESPATGFSLLVRSTSEVAVLHRETPLAVSSPYLRSLFTEAGVELVSGETLLLDAGLVKLLVEEALGAVSREETLLGDAKSRLLSASEEADSLDLGGARGPRAGGASRVSRIPRKEGEPAPGTAGRTPRRAGPREGDSGGLRVPAERDHPGDGPTPPSRDGTL